MKNTNIKSWISRNIWIWSVLGIIMLWIGICILQGKLDFSILRTNFALSCFLILMALGQMVIITSGDGAIDLSFVYIVSFAPYMLQLVSDRYGLFVGIIITLLLCAAVGFLNGVINLYLKVPAMITTLAVGYIVFSVTLMLSKNIAGVPSLLVKQIAQSTTWFGIPAKIVIILLFAALFAVLIYKTIYGKHLHAVGQNRCAARLAGISVPRTVITAFIIGAIMPGIAGILLNGYLGLAGQDVGTSYLLPCIATTIIGGTSIAGGRSSVIGVVAAGLMWTFLNAFLNLTWLTAAYQRLIQGAVLILVLFASVPKKQINK